MTKRTIAALCLVAALAGCGRSAPEATTEGRGNGIRWHGSIAAALAAAATSGKPVMAYFSSSRCSWCARLDRETFGDAGVRGLAGGFEAARVDAGKDPAAGRAYGIPALPTVLFLNADGKTLHRVVGFKPPARFVEEVRTALAAAR
jgi:thioredoxin-related protein